MFIAYGTTKLHTFAYIRTTTFWDAVYTMVCGSINGLLLTSDPNFIKNLKAVKKFKPIFGEFFWPKGDSFSKVLNPLLVHPYCSSWYVCNEFVENRNSFLSISIGTIQMADIFENIVKHIVTFWWTRNLLCCFMIISLQIKPKSSNL